MAKRISKKNMLNHIHRWEVTTEEEPTFCMCDEACSCDHYAYVIAECVCGATLDAYEIDGILNEYEQKPKVEVAISTVTLPASKVTEVKLKKKSRGKYGKKKTV